MNSVHLLGRLGKDPEVTYTQNQKTRATFSLAVPTNQRDENGRNKAFFVNCVAWDKTADLIAGSCKKGHKLLVDGYLNIRDWTDQQSQRHWVTEINVLRVDFVEPRENTGNPAAIPNAPVEPPYDETVPF